MEIDEIGVVECATLGDASSITECTNDAFTVDAFFKKNEYKIRFTLEQVIQMINTEDATFIVILAGNIDRDRYVVGSLYLRWEQQGNMLIGKISAVCVRKRFQKRGFGHRLIAGAENFLAKNAKESMNIKNVAVEMGILNVRGDLLPWYQAQGYSTAGYLRGDAELARVVAEEYDVYLIIIRKELFSI